MSELSRRALGSVLDAIYHPELDTLLALQAMGEMKTWMREREVYLVARAREEGVGWAEIAQALNREPDLMPLLYASQVKR